jgi:hypothetical protein
MTIGRELEKREGPKVFPRVCLAMLALGVFGACGKKEEPVTTSSAAQDGSARAATAGSTGLDPATPWRDPEWSFDPADPARDYVTRYVQTVSRYGAQTSCVVVDKSRFDSDKTFVDVRNDPGGSCGPKDELRDTFVVNVSGNRMSLDDAAHHTPLQRWPDGSDPGDPPGHIASVDDLRTWKAPLKKALSELQLVPIRVQLYGRGTYPVISIAGWHDPLKKDTPVEALRPMARTLCDANNAKPLGVFVGLDRVNLLRIDCPDTPRWDKLK